MDGRALTQAFRAYRRDHARPVLVRSGLVIGPDFGDVS